MYYFDTHIHTSEVSPCGNVSAADTVRLYYEAGFHGLYITDHYTSAILQRLYKDGSWKTAVDGFLQGYRLAKQQDDLLQMDILLGAELYLTATKREYLLYNVTEAFFYEYPTLYDLSIEELRDLADKHDVKIVQSHPFRAYLTPEEPRFLDGVEVINGNPRHESHNDKALAFAKQHGLWMTAGSDCHELEDVGRSGIKTRERIRTPQDFIQCITDTQTILLEVNQDDEI